MKILANDRFCGALGLMCRARGCVFGAQAVELAIKKGKALLVLGDSGMSDLSKETYEGLCSRKQIPYMEIGPEGTLGDACGRNNRLAAVTEKHFAEMIMKLYNDMSGSAEV